jgi:hypothetical protein
LVTSVEINGDDVVIKGEKYDIKEKKAKVYL